MTHDFESTNFGGSDYDPQRDLKRMADGMGAVFAVMKDTPHAWYTLEELADLSGVPQSSVGSYLCYLRRDYFYEVPKEHIKDGLYKYCLGDKLKPGHKARSAERVKKEKPRDILVLEAEHARMKEALEKLLSHEHQHGGALGEDGQFYYPIPESCFIKARKALGHD